MFKSGCVSIKIGYSLCASDGKKIFLLLTLVKRFRGKDVIGFKTIIMDHLGTTETKNNDQVQSKIILYSTNYKNCILYIILRILIKVIILSSSDPTGNVFKVNLKTIQAVDVQKFFNQR